MPLLSPLARQQAAELGRYGRENGYLRSSGMGKGNTPPLLRSSPPPRAPSPPFPGWRRLPRPSVCAAPPVLVPRSVLLSPHSRLLGAQGLKPRTVCPDRRFHGLIARSVQIWRPRRRPCPGSGHRRRSRPSCSSNSARDRRYWGPKRPTPAHGRSGSKPSGPHGLGPSSGNPQSVGSLIAGLSAGDPVAGPAPVQSGTLDRRPRPARELAR
jgi:hypothetical protein